MCINPLLKTVLTDQLKNSQFTLILLLWNKQIHSVNPSETDSSS